MKHAYVVRGHLRDPRHIELVEPLSAVQGEVEVVVRAVTPADAASDGEQSWERELDAWVQGHDRAIPVPTPESLHREAMYEDPK